MAPELRTDDNLLERGDDGTKGVAEAKQELQQKLDSAAQRMPQVMGKMSGEEKAVMMDQLRTIVQDALGNQHDGSLGRLNAKSFDKDGEAGLDAHEFGEFAKALDAAMDGVMKLGSVGEYTRVQQEIADKSGWGNADKWVADKTNYYEHLREWVVGEDAPREKSVSDVMREKYGTLTDEQRGEVGAREFSMTSPDAWRGVARLVAHDGGEMLVEDALKLLGNMSALTPLMPRYLNYRARANMEGPQQAEYEMKLNALVAENPAFAPAQLLGEKGVEAAKNLWKMMHMGTVDDVAKVTIMLAGAVVGGGTARIAMKMAARGERVAASAARNTAAEAAKNTAKEGTEAGAGQAVAAEGIAGAAKEGAETGAAAAAKEGVDAAADTAAGTAKKAADAAAEGGKTARGRATEGDINEYLSGVRLYEKLKASGANPKKVETMKQQMDGRAAKLREQGADPDALLREAAGNTAKEAAKDGAKAVDAVAEAGNTALDAARGRLQAAEQKLAELNASGRATPGEIKAAERSVAKQRKEVARQEQKAAEAKPGTEQPVDAKPEAKADAKPVETALESAKVNPDTLRRYEAALKRQADAKGKGAGEIDAANKAVARQEKEIARQGANPEAVKAELQMKKTAEADAPKAETPAAEPAAPKTEAPDAAEVPAGEPLQITYQPRNAPGQDAVLGSLKPDASPTPRAAQAANGEPLQITYQPGRPAAAPTQADVLPHLKPDATPALDAALNTGNKALDDASRRYMEILDGMSKPGGSSFDDMMKQAGEVDRLGGNAFQLAKLHNERSAGLKPDAGPVRAAEVPQGEPLRLTHEPAKAADNVANVAQESAKVNPDTLRRYEAALKRQADAKGKGAGEIDAANKAVARQEKEIARQGANPEAVKAELLAKQAAETAKQAERLAQALPAARNQLIALEDAAKAGRPLELPAPQAARAEALLPKTMRPLRLTAGDVAAAAQLIDDLPVQSMYPMKTAAQANAARERAMARLSEDDLPAQPVYPMKTAAEADAARLRAAAGSDAPDVPHAADVPPAGTKALSVDDVVHAAERRMANDNWPMQRMAVATAVAVALLWPDSVEDAEAGAGVPVAGVDGTEDAVYAAYETAVAGAALATEEEEEAASEEVIDDKMFKVLDTAMPAPDVQALMGDKGKAQHSLAKDAMQAMGATDGDALMNGLNSSDPEAMSAAVTAIEQSLHGIDSVQVSTLQGRLHLRGEDGQSLGRLDRGAVAEVSQPVEVALSKEGYPMLKVAADINGEKKVGYVSLYYVQKQQNNEGAAVA